MGGGKGKLTEDGWVVDTRSKPTRGTPAEINAANNKLVKENNQLRDKVEEQAVEIEELRAKVQAWEDASAGGNRVADIVAALELLDHGNDEHWTEEGLPRMEAVCEAMGDDTVTREEVETASPDFVRVVDPS